MSGELIFGQGFRTGLAKLAASDSGKRKPAGQAVEMPASPVAMENQSLQEQLDNLNLKMQLRQAGQAWTAAQTQDQMLAEQAQMEQAGGQQGQPQQGQPQPGGANPFMKNPAVKGGGVGLPTSPQDMIGAQ